MLMQTKRRCGKILVSSVELAKERVAKRVSEGGHGANASDIERRSSCKKITQSSRLV